MPALAAALGSELPVVRSEASKLLELMAGFRGAHAIEGATGALARAMSHRDAELRARVARCLAHIGSAAVEALPALRASLSDPEPEVRREAAKALWLVGKDRTGVAVLVRDLAAGSRWETRRLAAKTLGDMGQAGAEGLGEDH